MATENKVKMGIISGASIALKLKQQNPKMPDPDIMQEIAYEMKNILKKIDKNL